MAVAPLNSAFLATSILGFLISGFYVSSISKTWAFAFGTVFAVMFVASMVSMVSGPPDEQLGARKVL
ncbi:hypothetical protein C4580_04105 [Candidatus Woesearchaeota archaeon]|nr:MAG: hypothetical protein C4580_04105 [Candidatus Woesearchaeota archaeon]